MPRRRRWVCCLLPGIALRGYVPVRIVGLLPDGAIHLHIDDGVYQRTSVAVQQAIVADKNQLVLREGAVVGVARNARDEVVQRAVQRLADGNDIGELGGIADAREQLGERAERDAGHFRQLVVGDFALALDCLDAVEVRFLPVYCHAHCLRVLCLELLYHKVGDL